MASNIITIQRQFTAAMVAQERQAAARMASAYATSYRAIQQKFTQLSAQIQAAQDAGEPVSIGWLYDSQRLTVFRATVQSEMAKFSSLAQGDVTALQGDAVDLAKQHAKAAILAAVNDPAIAGQLAAAIDSVASRPDVVANLIGTLGNGSPLSTLFDKLGAEASKAARNVLIAGVANGTNPRVMASQLKDAMGGNLVRALTVARTETMRSYRAANLNLYRANDDVIIGWVWVCDFSADTCAACLAMSGTVHDLDEDFESHPNCRCAPAPLTADSGVDFQTGSNWFADQDEATQRTVLGNAGYDLYQQGAPLSAFVKTTESSKWGTSRTVKSAKDVAAELAA